jgi:hypothetical protein
MRRHPFGWRRFFCHNFVVNTAAVKVSHAAAAISSGCLRARSWLARLHISSIMPVTSCGVMFVGSRPSGKVTRARERAAGKERTVPIVICSRWLCRRT